MVQIPRLRYYGRVGQVPGPVYEVRDLINSFTDAHLRPEVSMAASKFLNPRLKVLICFIGMLLMGYFLYPAVRSGALNDTETIIRGVVFLGFAYFFIKNVGRALKGSGSGHQ